MLGSHTRRLCIAASRADARAAARRWRAGASGVPAHDAALGSRRARSRSTPTSVSFCTIHSSRSPFGDRRGDRHRSAASATVDRRRRRRRVAPLAPPARPPPRRAVGDGHRPRRRAGAARGARWWRSRRRARARRGRRRRRALRLACAAPPASSLERRLDPREQALAPATPTSSPRTRRSLRSSSASARSSLVGHLDVDHARAGRRARGRAGGARRVAAEARTRARAGCPAGRPGRSSPSSVASANVVPSAAWAIETGSSCDEVVAVAAKQLVRPRRAGGRRGRRPRRRAGRPRRGR